MVAGRVIKNRQWLPGWPIKKMVAGLVIKTRQWLLSWPIKQAMVAGISNDNGLLAYQKEAMVAGLAIKNRQMVAGLATRNR